MDKHAQDTIEHLFNQMDTPLTQQEEMRPAGEEDTTPFTQQPTKTVIHVYIDEEPGDDLRQAQDDEHSVEGTLENGEDDSPRRKVFDDLWEDNLFERRARDKKEGASSTVPSRPKPTPKKSIIPLLMLGVCLLVGLVVSAVSLLPLLTAQASVTLTPRTIQITSSSSLAVVTGGPPTEQQIPGRLLPSLTLTQTRTEATTGTGQQQAQAAHGLITLYNALPAVQSVPAGTLLVGADGVQVVTDHDAVIPAALMPTEGQVSVPARAVVMGPGGNIRAGDIYGACCRVNVFAVNAAFRGGQNARSFALVSQQDLDRAVATLKSSLAQSMTAVLQAHVSTDETLIAPVPCPAQVKADHAVGQEATQLRVTGTETCTAQAYNTAVLETLVKRITTQQAAHMLGAGYTLLGQVQTSITQATFNDHNGTTTLQVKGMGTWQYHFTQEQLERMATMIAGKSKGQALHLLDEQPGVGSVSLSSAGSDTTRLPDNASAIHLTVLSAG